MDLEQIRSRLVSIFEQNKTELIQLYIKERQSCNELGGLFNFVEETELKSMFYSVSNPIISEETKREIVEKNNERNTLAFFFLIDVKSNTTILLLEDLDKSN